MGIILRVMSPWMDATIWLRDCDELCYNMVYGGWVGGGRERGKSASCSTIYASEPFTTITDDDGGHHPPTTRHHRDGCGRLGGGGADQRDETEAIPQGNTRPSTDTLHDESDNTEMTINSQSPSSALIRFGPFDSCGCYGEEGSGLVDHGRKQRNGFHWADQKHLFDLSIGRVICLQIFV